MLRQIFVFVCKTATNCLHSHYTICKQFAQQKTTEQNRKKNKKNQKTRATNCLDCETIAVDKCLFPERHKLFTLCVNEKNTQQHSKKNKTKTKQKKKTKAVKKYLHANHAQPANNLHFQLQIDCELQIIVCIDSQCTQISPSPPHSHSCPTIYWTNEIVCRSPGRI